MKKILAIALALVMVLGLASSALAVSWAAPSVSSAASPFAIEVIKLSATTNVTGGRYFTVLSEAAAYDLSNIFFAIKLSVPSYANANSYYGNSGFMSGDKVRVTVDFTNVSGKGSETYYVKLTNEAQTLWYNGSGFDATWTASLANNCGCGDRHILSAVAVGGKEITIKASVGASGELSSLKIDGCYSVEKKTFNGVVPCINCTPTNLSGYLLSGDCSSYGVFFTTNSAGKVTAAYVADKCATQTNYFGSVASFNTPLYGWMPNGVWTNCQTGVCGYQAFSLVELQKGDKINSGNDWKTWVNDRKSAGKDSNDTKLQFEEWANATNDNKLAVETEADTAAGLYIGSDAYMYLYKVKDGKYHKVSGWDTGDYSLRPDDFKTIDTTMYQAGHNVDSARLLVNRTIQVGTGLAELITRGTVAGDAKYFYKPDTGDDAKDLIYAIDNGTILKRTVLGKPYGDVSQVEYGKLNYVVKSSTDWRLFKQTSAVSVNCDGNEAAYLNALNHVYALLGFTYADWAAGNVYMTDYMLLTNFGFTASVSDSKTWGVYTAAITVAPVAEVPATGSIAYAGFAMIVLAVAAAVVTKKVRA